MTTEISLVDARPRPLAVVKVTTVLSKWPREFRQSLDTVYAAVKAGQVRQSGHNVMVYRPRADGLVDIECGIDTVDGFRSAGEVVSSVTPSGPAATATHVGAYKDLGSTHDAIVTWYRAHGWRATGVCWEIYGDWNADESKLCTDIFHLLER